MHTVTQRTYSADASFSLKISTEFVKSIHSLVRYMGKDHTRTEQLAARNKMFTDADKFDETQWEYHFETAVTLAIAAEDQANRAGLSYTSVGPDGNIRYMIKAGLYTLTLPGNFMQRLNQLIVYLVAESDPVQIDEIYERLSNGESFNDPDSLGSQFETVGLIIREVNTMAQELGMIQEEEIQVENAYWSSDANS